MKTKENTLMLYALKLIEKRMYTVRGMREKLKSKERALKVQETSNKAGSADAKTGKKRGESAETQVGIEEIEQVISKLKEYKYLDDGEYAGAYIRDQIARKPQGIRLLRMNLSKKGVTSEVIVKAITEYNMDEMEIALRAVSGKRKALTKYPQKTRREKLYRFLLSRGFNMETVLKVVRELP